MLHTCTGKNDCVRVNWWSDGVGLWLSMLTFLPSNCSGLFLALRSYWILIMNVPWCRKPPVFEKRKWVFWAFAGCLGALEWTLSEARHVWYGRRYFCLDPVWRKMVCGVSEWPRSPGRHYFPLFPRYLMDKDWILIAVLCLNTQFSWRWTLLSSRWVTLLGHMMALKPSSHTGTALCWLARSVDKDTGPQRLTWRVKSPVASGHLMISRYTLCNWAYCTWMTLLTVRTHSIRL